MPRITADGKIAEQMRTASTEVEIVDDQGKSLGMFVPMGDSQADFLEQARKRYTEEDIRRLQAQTGGKSLSQFWKEMGVK